MITCSAFVLCSVADTHIKGRGLTDGHLGWVVSASNCFFFPKYESPAEWSVYVKDGAHQVNGLPLAPMHTAKQR